MDEDNHGWPPDSGGSSEAIRQGIQKAWEANDIQPEAHGDGDASPDPDDPRLPSENVGQSMNRSGEDVAGPERKEAGRQDTGPAGEPAADRNIHGQGPDEHRPAGPHRAVVTRPGRQDGEPMARP